MPSSQVINLCDDDSTDVIILEVRPVIRRDDSGTPNRFYDDDRYRRSANPSIAASVASYYQRNDQSLGLTRWSPLTRDPPISSLTRHPRSSTPPPRHHQRQHEYPTPTSASNTASRKRQSPDPFLNAQASSSRRDPQTPTKKPKREDSPEPFKDTKIKPEDSDSDPEPDHWDDSQPPTPIKPEDSDDDDDDSLFVSPRTPSDPFMRGRERHRSPGSPTPSRGGEAAADRRHGRRPDVRSSSKLQFTSLADIWANPDRNGVIWFPTKGPPCRRCRVPTSWQKVLDTNTRGNVGRPYYRCTPCDNFHIWGDLVGISPENDRCRCGNPTRAGVTTEKAKTRGPGETFFKCAEGRCGTFVWKD
ncbi:hypothetical protein B0T17DRAFT_82178 [Bombardia bombarda]|uniref:GRF-type domain-containing protein n=1 Tax=Bombardia bombarda TaxID=252184 RepID=A0AA40CFK0_9PEZI|nr:hypothetical protein B0T17DRAFT_82178 [Bombardia bombarda]